VEFLKTKEISGIFRNSMCLYEFAGISGAITEFQKFLKKRGVSGV
jgi:hypothetical protein